MSMPLKVQFWVVGGFAAVAAMLAAAFLLWLETEPARTHLEAVLATTLHMDVQIDGPVQVGYSRGLIVTLGDLRVSKRERNVAAVQAVEFGVEVMPLLYGRLRLRSVALRSPVITLERASDGALSVDRPAAEGTTAHAFGRLVMTDGLLRYVDAGSNRPILEGRVCGLDLHGVEVGPAMEPDFWKRFAFAGHVACGEVEAGAFTASGLELAVDASATDWVAEVLTMNLFGGKGSGTLHVDLSHSTPRHAVRYTLMQFHIEEFFRALSPHEVVAGDMTFTADLSARGHTFDEARRSLEGAFGLRGEALKLHGTDIDDTFSDYEASQRFDLIDLGALFLPVPSASLSPKDSTSRAYPGIRGATARSARWCPTGTLRSVWPRHTT